MVITKDTLLDKISKYSIIDQLVETIFVSNSKGTIETINTLKDGGIIKQINDVIDYNLNSHGFIINDRYIISDTPFSETITNNKSLSECISSIINSDFINEIKKFKNIQKFNFRLTRSLISKIINPDINTKLIDKIIQIGKGCSWLIIPISIAKLITLSNKFIPNNTKSDSIMYEFGKLGDIILYINPDYKEKNLYFGNYNSVSIILNKNIKNLKFKTRYKVEVDYLFIEKGVTKLLKLD